MQRVYVNFQFKKIVIFFITIITFIIALSVIVVGLEEKDEHIDSLQNYKLNEENIVLKKIEGNPRVKLYIKDKDKIVDMELEEYVRGVVAAEMPANFNLEALKAQAVAARTYVLAHMKAYNGGNCSIGKGADVCDTTHCQAYVSKEERFDSWSKQSAVQLWSKVTKAVSETAGQVLTYDGELVMRPYYFAISSGKTENVAEVFSGDSPYLKSVDSTGDRTVKNYQVTTNYTYSKLATLINSKYPKAKVSANNLKNQISILKRTSGGGSVSTIKIGSAEITGPQFRTLLNLRSSNFTISFNSKTIKITCKGYGHGVGMSQWGADAMAEDGKNYKQILTHYYQGVEIKKIEDLN